LLLLSANGFLALLPLLLEAADLLLKLVALIPREPDARVSQIVLNLKQGGVNFALLVTQGELIALLFQFAPHCPERVNGVLISLGKTLHGLCGHFRRDQSFSHAARYQSLLLR